MKSLVSIIIPTFNRAALIEATLNSILNQSYSNWECLVIDDGSTDNTIEILTAFCDNDARFKYYERPKNRPKGANACRNYGLELSNGTFINWFDSDDLMLPNKLLLQVAQLEKSSLNYSICQTERYDIIENKSLGLRSDAIHSKDILNDYIMFKIFWMTGAPLWRKDFLNQNKFCFDEALQQSQDYDYHINIIAKDACYEVINAPLMRLCKHESNMSNNLFDDSLKIYSNIKSRYKALSNHLELLNTETKVFLLKKQFEFYRKGIINLHWNDTLKAYLLLCKSYRLVSTKVRARYTNPIKWLVGSLTYKLIGKGERFLKLPPL
tara:strand:- start:137642 stop:138610 length:969 start_codon:yes stop_codon:yes gene_type:complete